MTNRDGVLRVDEATELGCKYIMWRQESLARWEYLHSICICICNVQLRLMNDWIHHVEAREPGKVGGNFLLVFAMYNTFNVSNNWVYYEGLARWAAILICFFQFVQYVSCGVVIQFAFVFAMYNYLLASILTMTECLWENGKSGFWEKDNDSWHAC